MAAWVQLASVETPDSSACVVLGTLHERYARASDRTPIWCSSLIRSWLHKLAYDNNAISTYQGSVLCRCLCL